MANTCFTSFYVQSSDTEGLKHLAEKIETWADMPDYMTGGHSRWLGNILGYSGIADPEDLSIRCNGRLINDICLEGDTLSFHTETAWTPMVKMWRILCDRFLSDYTIDFNAEEEGCGLFWTTDPDNGYILDIYDMFVPGFESDWDCPEKGVIAFLQMVLQTDEPDIEVLLEEFEKSDLSEHASIHKWEYISDITQLD